MSVSGNIDHWAEQFPQDQIPRIVQLLLDSWGTFKVPTKLLEVPITRDFCAHLRKNRDRSVHWFRIDWESTELDEQGNEKGRIDLKFSQGWDERVYFSIECKRLRVHLTNGFRSLAGEYVREGMYRYFSGKYALNLDQGGMLGYVMDGDINNAVQDVAKAIEKRRSELYLAKTETLHKSSIIRSLQVKETCHQYGPNGRFVIYHLFLPLNFSPE